MADGCGVVLGTHRKVRPRVLASVAEIASEDNESMLVTVPGAIPVATGFDTTGTDVEFKIGGDLVGAWVGGDTFTPDGVGYTIVPAPGMILDAVTGIVGARVVSTVPPRPDPGMLLRLEPRRDNDVDRHYTGVDSKSHLGSLKHSKSPRLNDEL